MYANTIVGITKCIMLQCITDKHLYFPPKTSFPIPIQMGKEIIHARIYNFAHKTLTRLRNHSSIVNLAVAFHFHSFQIQIFGSPQSPAKSRFDFGITVARWKVRGSGRRPKIGHRLATDGG